MAKRLTAPDGTTLRDAYLRAEEILRAASQEGRGLYGSRGQRLEQEKQALTMLHGELVGVFAALDTKDTLKVVVPSGSHAWSMMHDKGVDKVAAAVMGFLDRAENPRRRISGAVRYSGKTP